MTDTASMSSSMQEHHLSEIQFTPLRAASQSYSSTRVDTEGRRSRFRSPPPPPGASPSLLLPTPRRYTSNEYHGNLSEEGASYTAESVKSGMSPLKAPVFELESVKNSQYYEGDSQEVVRRLHQWYIKFKPRGKAPLPSGEYTSHLSHWIVVVGLQIAVQNNDKQGVRKEPWRSSLVHIRKSATQFETASGSMYELSGPCDFDQTCMRTCPEFAAKFKDGLPEDWMDLVAREAHRLSHVQIKDEGNCNAEHNKQIKKDTLKRKMLSPLGSEIVSLSRRASEVSMSLPTSPIRPHKKSSSNQKQESASNCTPKGISRELLQLRTSKLGNLSLVEAAILEEMDTPERHAPRNLEKVNSEAAEMETSENVVVGQKDMNPVGKIGHTSKTPLRSSNRARNGVREWWKVSSKNNNNAKQRTTTHTKANKVEHTKTEESPGTRMTTEQTDLSDSEEEFKFVSSSEDDEVEMKEVEQKVAPKKYTRKSRISNKANLKSKDEVNLVSMLEPGNQDDQSLGKQNPIELPVLPVLSKEVDDIERRGMSTKVKGVPLAAVEVIMQEIETQPIVNVEVAYDKDMQDDLLEIEKVPGGPHCMDEEMYKTQIVEDILTDKQDDQHEELPEVLMINDDGKEQVDREESLFYFSD